MEVFPNSYKLVVDEYGNHYAEFDFSRQPAGTVQTVKIDYRVTVNELTYDLSVCQGLLPKDFTQPELHIESANPQIVAIASDLSKGQGTVCKQVRAFYEYVSNNLVYTYNGANWGAQATLGSMGADCTEYTALLVALNRAKGIPARYFEGLLYLDRERMPSLKRSMPGRMCTCRRSAGSQWIPPLDAHWSTVPPILPTILQTISSSRWG